MNCKIKKTILLILVVVLLFLVGSFVVFYFKLDKNIDLSLIKPTGSTITRIYYFDYEDRENRVGKPVELKEEQIFLQKSEWKSLYEIPQNLIDAFVAIEDKRFFDHNGVDWLRTIKATTNYIFGKDKSSFGGSTITQQLIKNLTGDNKATPKRKLEEIFRALNLEKNISKNKILETYLNIVYLSENCYGVGVAAETYFDKSIEDLSLSECASLASIVKNPTKYDPYLNPEENNKRKNVVLKEMLDQKYITNDEYEKAIAETIYVNKMHQDVNHGIYSWYTEAIIHDITNDLCDKYKINEKTARMMILKGGLNIYSTIDPNLQKKLESVYLNYKTYLKMENGEYPQSSCVLIDAKTSDVLAIVGGIGEKRANMILNRAVYTKRPPGSVLKPLSVYAPSVEEGLVVDSTIVEDTPLNENGNWPKNSPDRYRGIMPISYALAHSVNTVSVKTLEKLGIDTSYKYLTTKFKLNLVEKDKALAPLGLGQLTYGESLINLTNAYTSFANGGYLSKPRTYLYVTDNEGNVILSNEEQKTQALSLETSQIITKMLEKVVKEGTARCINIKDNISVAGKTGTSSDNKDKWFIGYTPELVCGVWTGFDTPKAINTNINPSCIIFNEIISKAYENTEVDLNFKTSENIIEVEYCRDSGCLPTYMCNNDIRGDRTTTGFFVKGTEPKDSCTIHKEVYIDIVDGKIADDYTPMWRKRLVSFLDYERKKKYNVKILDEDYFIISRIKNEN